MMNPFWQVAASAATSVLVGVFVVIALVIYERTQGRLTTSGKFVACLLLSTAVYTLIISIIGYFWMGVSLPMSISNFGEARYVWLFIGLAADGCGRIYGFFA